MEFSSAFPYDWDVRNLKNILIKSAVILTVALWIHPGPAPTLADTPYIPVGKAKAKKTVIALAPILVGSDAGSTKSVAAKIRKQVDSDLQFMDLFRMLPPSTFTEDASKAALSLGQINFQDWTGIGAEILVKSKLTVNGDQLVLEGFVYDTFRGQQLLGKRYVGNSKDLKVVAHTFANDIVERLTGLPGVFLTKIAMTCDRSGKKEIYVMNFDGTDVRRITNHRSIAIAPAWSPDGTRLAYSLYTRHRKNRKNLDLYEYNFTNNTVRLLTNKKGINSGAVYHPNGKSVALTMSFLGNPEIFSLDLKTRRVTRLTKSFGFDVDPAWSPDGSRLAFVSSRAGKPMIYTMNKGGGGVKRLTFAGRYNSTPSWSPTNNKMAFAGWIDGKFDIFLMNPDGTKIERLTKRQGNNEDPYLSPDGNFVTFSSDRSGKRNIYVMNIDGTFVKRLTYGLGNCSAPKWSNPPRPS